MSKIVILIGSQRKNGNTDLLAQSFAEGAREHNEVELISVANHTVKPCTGCNYCYKNDAHLCCQKDDMNEIYDKLREADVLVITSPVYFYGISAQLKAVVDRLHSPIRKNFRIRKMALLSVGADTMPELFDAIIAQYRLSLNYFSFEDLGMVPVRGVEEKGSIEGNAALKEAYELGLSIK